MLRRIIASILVLALFGYGTAWAFAGHVSDIAAHAVGDVHADAPQLPDEDGCDHCCHAAAHLIGLASPFAESGRRAVDVYGPGVVRHVSMLALPPPLRPPRI